MSPIGPAIRTKHNQPIQFNARHNIYNRTNVSILATIGITEYAAKALGDVVFVELPEVDADVAAGDSIGAVESVKSASDINAPISGLVVEANTVLSEKPKVVNDSPEGDGWFAKIQISDKSELDNLLDKEAYQASLEE